MIDFPASPTVGQIFTSGGQQWMWDGAKWLPNGQINTAVVPMNDNRVINGDMRIDQRNNGASGTALGYTVDRWQYNATQTARITWQRGTVSAPGLINGLGYALAFTVSSAFTPATSDTFFVMQPIEADMITDFAWGTPNAQPVTLSFWAFSSLTSTFSGCICNAPSPPTRSYPFTFTINTVNVWQKFVVTIPGDTAGTWVLQGNAAGLFLYLVDLGSGATYRGPANAWASANYRGATGAVSLVATAGATISVTGVKLEIGTVATPFNRQSLAKSLADCQRYYADVNFSCGGYAGATGSYAMVWLPVQMRALPSATLANLTYTNGSAASVSNARYNMVLLVFTTTAGGNAVVSGDLLASAEL